MALEPFDTWGTEVDPNAEPTKPPPDANKPYMWVGDEWVLIVTDTSDGVPEELHLEPTRAELQKRAHMLLRLPELRSDQPRDAHGRFDFGTGKPAATNAMGGPLRSSFPGRPGGPPEPRASLAATTTAAGAAAVTSKELEGVMGRPVPVNFKGLSPAVARETGEGLLMAAERYPNNDLMNVRTYGPGGMFPTHSSDPTMEAAAFTLVAYAGHGQDQLWVSTGGGEAFIRANYASSARMGNNAAPNPTGTAVHEMGHVVSLHSSADIGSTQVILDHAAAAGIDVTRSGPEVAMHVARNISVYAASSPEEAMAESFADVVVNGSGASALSQSVFQVIDGYYQSDNLP